MSRSSWDDVLAALEHALVLQASLLGGDMDPAALEDAVVPQPIPDRPLPLPTEQQARRAAQVLEGLAVLEARLRAERDRTGRGLALHRKVTTGSDSRTPAFVDGYS